MMPLDLPAGQTVFLDSTVIHYAFVDFPGATRQCIELLYRIATTKLAGCRRPRYSTAFSCASADLPRESWERPKRWAHRDLRLERQAPRARAAPQLKPVRVAGRG